MKTQITLQQFDSFLSAWCKRKKISYYFLCQNIIKMDYGNFHRLVKNKDGGLKKKIEILKKIGFEARAKTIINLKENTGEKWKKLNTEL